MGPNLLQSLGARSLGGTHKGLHLRRYFSRLHDVAGLAGDSGSSAVVAESDDGGVEEEVETEVEDGNGNEEEMGESQRAPEADR
ncbi:hypothetical protein ACFXTH_026680 [Malus domestica]